MCVHVCVVEKETERGTRGKQSNNTLCLGRKQEYMKVLFSCILINALRYQPFDNFMVILLVMLIVSVVSPPVCVLFPIHL